MSNEQYQEICKERLDDISNKIDSLDKKLFYDNGNECLQSKVNRHEQILGYVKWLALGMGAILLQLVASVLYQVIELIKKP